MHSELKNEIISLSFSGFHKVRLTSSIIWVWWNPFENSISGMMYEATSEMRDIAEKVQWKLSRTNPHAWLAMSLKQVCHKSS